MKYKKIIINGRFLSQNITGVQRYAREIFAELDKLCEGVEIIMAVDKHAENIPHYKNIKVHKCGVFSGTLWGQISLPLFVLKNKGLCVSVANVPPILTPHVIAVHDVNFKVNRQFFSKGIALWYNFAFGAVINRIKDIITISEFSKSEICRVYKKDYKNITITYTGWQHFEKLPYDESALQKYGLEKGKFYFAMSSMSPNKNFRWIAEAARKNPDCIFAVSGQVDKKIFGDGQTFDAPENMKFLGYVSDGEAKTLMRDSRAFLFPTFYEGFGMPPLEALSTGAKAVVSDANCMREIFGNCVYYIDPDNPDVDLEKLLEKEVIPPDGLLRKYSWKKAAEILYNDILMKYFK